MPEKHHSIISLATVISNKKIKICQKVLFIHSNLTNEKSKLNIVNITRDYVQIIKFCYTFGQIFSHSHSPEKITGFIIDGSKKNHCISNNLKTPNFMKWSSHFRRGIIFPNSLNIHGIALLIAAGVFCSPQSLMAANNYSGVPEHAMQQETTVKGTVVGADGMPLPGVTVKLKGTTVGTATDADGIFQIKVPNRQKAVLEFSYIGMKPKEVKVEGKDNLLIEMEDDNSLLEEVVVTGYGNVKKTSYTGSASVLNTDKHKDLPVVSMTQMMEANMPGVRLITSNGSPGSNTSIRVRGFGSLSASNAPLFVLDGVPVESGDMSNDEMNGGGMGILSTINPSDIESITVLKDAASASLYGARGANGVILVTTKKGKKGKTTYNFKASYGISDMATKFRPTMGGAERRALILEGLTNRNLLNGQSLEWAQEHAEEEIDNYARIPAGGYADWENALFRTAHQQNYDFSISGGTDDTRFAGSISYTNQENIAYKSGFERYSGHLNFNNHYRNFDVGMNALFSLTKKEPLPGGGFYSNPMYALKVALNPSIPIYNEDGSYNENIPEISRNLLLDNEVNDMKTQIARTFASIEAGYTFIKGLRLSELFNVDYTYTKEFRYFSPKSSDGKTPNGQGVMFNTDNLTYNSQTRLNFIHDFDDHSIDLLAAYEIKRWNKEYNFAYAKNYSTDKKEVMDNASIPAEIEHYRDSDSMLSYVFRANYDYKDRYFLSASFRRDGSSRLDPDNRWDNFWSISGSWRFSQEEFIQPMSGWLNDAKLRLSYGVNGNIPNTLYSYYGLYDLNYVYNDEPGMVESSLRNSRLSWEKNYAFNIGLDLFLFDRLSVSFDWYRRDTKDLLLSRTVNPITGFGSITDNVGKMRNTGFEIELSSTNISTRDFSWTTTFNLSHNKNKIVKLADVPEYFNGTAYIVKEGCSLGTFALREYAGVDPENGKPLYYSNRLQEDGTRSREKVTDPNLADRVPICDSYPDVTGGLSNTFRYKIFDLNFNLSFSLGGYSYDNYIWALQDDGYNSMAPKSTELRRRWQKPGDITDVPRYVAGQEYGGWWHTSRAIHSTDHLRLKSLTLGVRAPQKWLDASGLSTARIYVSGTNLLTWAKYDQYDPELTGLVNCDIPPLRTIAVGLEIGF